MPPFYRPILSGRAGEFEGFAHLSEQTWVHTLPVIEVQAIEDPHAPVTGEDTGIKGTSRWFNRKLRELVVKYQRIDGLTHFAIDTDGLPDDPGLPPDRGVLWDALDQVSTTGVTTVPVIRLTKPGGWNDVARWGADRSGVGLILRLTRADLRQPDAHLLPQIQQALAAARTPGIQTDLLIDLDRTPPARQLPAILGRIQAVVGSRLWRSLTIASGAFPQDLSGIKPFELAEIPRADAATWSKLRAMGGFADLDYSDYGVGYPQSRPPGRFSAPPQIRYAVPRRWLVVKGHRNRNREFFNVCRLIHAHPEFTEGLGRADLLIKNRATGAGGTVAGDTAAEWRGLSTGHHLDFIVERLRRAGVAEPE